MKLTGESKLFLGMLAITAVIIALASVVLTKPAPTYTKEQLIPKSAHTKGNSQAKTILVEFSDFQCPACLAAKPTVDALLRKYPDTLLFAYRHFPLDQHPFAKKAAQAAEAAANQGKFWEMYDALFSNQTQFKDELFPKLAMELNLNMEKFTSDMSSKEASGKVDTDQQAGIALGVNSTPTFFLNGKKLNLTSFSDLTRIVEESIQSSK
jgi:protein-disulfide isomerase